MPIGIQMNGERWREVEGGKEVVCARVFVGRDGIKSLRSTIINPISESAYSFFFPSSCGEGFVFLIFFFDLFASRSLHSVIGNVQ